MNRTPADRLRQLRIAKGFASAAEAARAYGWNEQTYKSHENGIRGMKQAVVERYAAALGSTAAFILGISTDALPRSPITTVAHVPVIGRASAGTFRFEEADEFEGIMVPAVPKADAPAHIQYSLLIDGPSVNKKIPDQSFAICVPYAAFPGGPKHGQLVHVVRTRSGLIEHTVKELRFTADGQKLYPVSTDPRHQEPITLETGEDGELVHIEGIVIGAYTPL